jgi:hypothetical protein
MANTPENGNDHEAAFSEPNHADTVSKNETNVNKKVTALCNRFGQRLLLLMQQRITQHLARTTRTAPDRAPARADRDGGRRGR